MSLLLFLFFIALDSQGYHKITDFMETTLEHTKAKCAPTHRVILSR